MEKKRGKHIPKPPELKKGDLPILERLSKKTDLPFSFLLRVKFILRLVEESKKESPWKDMTINDVAAIFGCDRATLFRAVQFYKRSGIIGLLEGEEGTNKVDKKGK